MKHLLPILLPLLLAGCSIREVDVFGYDTGDLILRVEELPPGPTQDAGRALVREYQALYLAGRPEAEWRKPLAQLARLLGVTP
jgi:hypothetical protein